MFFLIETYIYNIYILYLYILYIYNDFQQLSTILKIKYIKM